MVDARLPTGERVNVIIPPLALDGADAHHPPVPAAFTGSTSCVGRGSLDEPTAALLRALRARAAQHHRLRRHRLGQDDAAQRAVGAHPGATSASSPSRTPPSCRCSRSTWSRLESRPANVEGKGQVTIRDLVRNALRMRPDRIIVGEVRGGETLDMLQAMNTGHEGSLATVHANSAVDALGRLETLAA